MRRHHQRKHRQTSWPAVVLGVVILAVVTGIAAGSAGAAGLGSSRPSAAQVIRISTHSFDWGDAGIGAAAGIGLSMLAVGATLLLTSARREHQSQPRLTVKEQP